MKLDEIEERPEKRSLIGRIGGSLRSAFQSGVDLAMPPNCLACGRRVAADGALCATCWGMLRFIERPYCAQLGIPFAYDLGPNVLSAEAIADPPPFERCRAVAAYDDVARKLIHGLKYRDRQELARWMGVWMARAGREVAADADLIVPIPLHRWRLWRRRFNQSAMLSVAIGKEARKPVDLHALKRVKATRQQVGLTANERDENVRGAFLVAKGDRAAIAGRRVLLVDDVYTTGATAKAATRALLRAGAAAVDVLVFARVVRGVQ
jgi:ComF family protein